MNPLPVAAAMVMAFLAVMFGNPAAGTSAEGVLNGSARTSLSGWSADAADGSVKVQRVSLTNAPASTGVRLRRSGGSTSWAMALVKMRKKFFVPGQTYRMSAWVRDLSGSGKPYGILLANHAFQHRPTEVSEHGNSTGAWRQVGRTFVATSAGASDTSFYFSLPTSGSFDFEVTAVSVRKESTAMPARAKSAASSPSKVIKFDGAAGSAPDSGTWNYQTGGGGWGNGEPQVYTSSRENSYLDGQGNLKITVNRTDSGFTSARINTQNKVAVQPGSYIESSITAPVGSSVWPAFWLLGTNLDKVGWPACGELDILEGTGATPTVAHAAMHMNGTTDTKAHLQYGWGESGGTTDLGVSIDAAPHRYGVYFDAKVVRFYVDRKPTLSVWAGDAMLAGKAWPFGKPHFILLNVAIDGRADNSATTFPRTMTVGPISIWKGGLPF